MSIPDINQLPTERAQELLVGQYADSENLKAYIDVVAKQFDELHASGLKSLSNRPLAVAIKAQLEAIGVLVGQARGTYKEFVGDYFGFEGAVGAGTFGTVGDAGQGELFLSTGDEDFNIIPWGDDLYRKFIKARIIKNTSAITIDVIIEITLLILDSITHVTVTNDAPKHFTVDIVQTLSDFDKQLLLSDLDIVPVPVGVGHTINYSLV